jgi:ribosome-binding factor A
VKQFPRSSRLNDQLREEIAKLLESEAKDPRIGFVTISEVEVAQDLKTAKVFYTVYGDDKAKRDTEVGLRHVAGFIRKRLGEMLRIRSIPELRFIFDEGLERGTRVLQLLNELEDTK